MTKTEMIASTMRMIMGNRDMSLMVLDFGKPPMGFWTEVFDNLPKGHSFRDSNALAYYYGKEYKKPIIQKLIDSHYVRNDHCRPLPESHLLSTQSLTEADLRKIVQSDLEKRLSEPCDLIVNEHVELCPEAAAFTGLQKERRLTRKHDCVSVTVDRNLWGLFTNQQKCLRTSASRFMNSILRAHFNEPKL